VEEVCNKFDGAFKLTEVSMRVLFPLLTID
jgi:hypothetical protein